MLDHPGYGVTTPRKGGSGRGGPAASSAPVASAAALAPCGSFTAQEAPQPPPSLRGAATVRVLAPAGRYRFAFVLDKTSMFRIVSERPADVVLWDSGPSGGSAMVEFKHSVKPLQLLWTKFDFWTAKCALRWRLRL